MDERPSRRPAGRVTRLIAVVRPERAAPAFRSRALRATAGTSRKIVYDRVDDEAARLVGEVDLDGLRLVVRLGVGRRQAGERRLARRGSGARGRRARGRSSRPAARRRAPGSGSRRSPAVGYSSATGSPSRFENPSNGRGTRCRYDRPVAQRRAEMEQPERAVPVDPEDEAQPAVATGGAGASSARHSMRRSRGSRPAPSHSSAHVQRCSPVADQVLRQGVRTAARGPEAAMGDVQVDDRLGAGDEVDVVGRGPPGRGRAGGSPRPASAGRTSSRRLRPGAVAELEPADVGPAAVLLRPDVRHREVGHGRRPAARAARRASGPGSDSCGPRPSQVASSKPGHGLEDDPDAGDVVQGVRDRRSARRRAGRRRSGGWSARGGSTGRRRSGARP